MDINKLAKTRFSERNSKAKQKKFINIVCEIDCGIAAMKFVFARRISKQTINAVRRQQSSISTQESIIGCQNTNSNKTFQIKIK